MNCTHFSRIVWHRTGVEADHVKWVFVPWESVGSPCWHLSVTEQTWIWKVVIFAIEIALRLWTDWYLRHSFFLSKIRYKLAQLAVINDICHYCTKTWPEAENACCNSKNTLRLRMHDCWRKYRGADKSLARSGRKQATATKLYFLYSTKKKIQKVVRPTRSSRQQWPRQSGRAKDLSNTPV